MTESIDLKTLSQRADVTPRTIHYYIQQGLLQPPDGGGRGARYGPAHLVRLRLIRRLQRDHLPLSEIRRQLDALSEADAEALLRERDAAAPPDSALDYVRRVLARDPGAPSPPLSSSARAPMGAPQSPPAPPASPAPGAMPVSSSTTTPARPGSPAPGRSQWDRIALTDDIEIHIRRPLAREQNRQVDKLLGLAREIIRGDDR